MGKNKYKPNIEVNLIFLAMCFAPIMTEMDPTCIRYKRIEKGKIYYIKNNGYPNKYVGKTHCVLTVESPPDYRVQINCPQIQIPKSTNCMDDRISISTSGDVGLEDSHVYCGRRRMNSVSDSNKLIIGFHSPSSSVGGKYSCTVRTIPKAGVSRKAAIVGEPEQGLDEEKGESTALPNNSDSDEPPISSHEVTKEDTAELDDMTEVTTRIPSQDDYKENSAESDESDETESIPRPYLSDEDSVDQDDDDESIEEPDPVMSNQYKKLVSQVYKPIQAKWPIRNLYNPFGSMMKQIIKPSRNKFKYRRIPVSELHQKILPMMESNIFNNKIPRSYPKNMKVKQYWSKNLPTPNFNSNQNLQSTAGEKLWTRNKPVRPRFKNINDEYEMFLEDYLRPENIDLTKYQAMKDFVSRIAKIVDYAPCNLQTNRNDNEKNYFAGSVY